MALGFLLATLVAMLLSSAPPAGAVVPAGKAFAWGQNDSGQLGNGTSGAGAESDIPVAVKNLSNAKSIGGGYNLTLAASQ